MSIVRKKVFIVIFLCIILALYAPVMFTIVKGLHYSSIVSVLLNKSYYRVFFFTIFQATISTFFSMLVGIPVAYILCHYRFRGRKIIHIITLVPFVIPSILLILGFVIVWGNNGLVNQSLQALLTWIGIPYTAPVIPLMYSFPAIIIAHVFYNFGIFAHIVYTRWSTVSKSQLYGARNLGASHWHVCKDIIFPHLKPAILSASAIVFLLCFTSFAIVLILGGGPWYSTLETAIYKLVKVEFNFDEASTLAFFQILITFTITLLLLRNQQYNTTFVTNQPSALLSQSRAKHFIYAYLFVIYSFVIVLFLAIILLSFIYTRKGVSHFGIYGYIMLFKNSSIISSVLYSIMISVLSTSIALLLSLYIAILLYTHNNQKVSQLIQSVMFLPYFISPIILSLSYSHLKVIINDESFLLLIVVHSILTIPFLTRLIVNALSQIKISIIHSAKTLGAHFLQLLATIYIPLIIPSLIVASSLSLCISLGELSAALMLAPRNMPTIPIMIYNLLSKYRFLDATRMGVLLITLTAMLLVCIDIAGNSIIGNKLQRRKNLGSML